MCLLCLHAYLNGRKKEVCRECQACAEGSNWPSWTWESWGDVHSLYLLMNVTYTFYIMDTHTLTQFNNLCSQFSKCCLQFSNLCSWFNETLTLMPFSHSAYIITMDCFDLIRFYFDLGLRYDGFISEILYKNNILFHRHLSSSS